MRANATGSQRLLVRFSTSAVLLRYWNGSTWSTLASDTGGASAADTWYDARIVTDGATVKMYRSQSGGPESEIFSHSSATQFDSKQVWVHSPPNQQPFYAKFRVLADDIKRTVTYGYRDNNEITSMADYNGSSAYAYDDWGRMTSETRNSKSRTFAYTMGSKLASVNGNLGGLNTVTYGYSGDGKRLYRTHNGTTTHGYHWDAGYNVLNEADASGALAKTYVVAPKPVTGAVPGVPMEGVLVNQGPVGMTLAEVAGTNPATGAYRYYAQDNIQSTRGLFEQNKALAGTLEYTPYGEGYATPAPTTLTHRFTGLDLDAVTGQYYAPYRYYDPNLARWLTRDPLGMVDGPNMFGFLRSAPTMFIDRLGLAVPVLAALLIAFLVLAAWSAACYAAAIAKTQRLAREGAFRDSQEMHRFTSCYYNRCRGLLDPLGTLMAGFIVEVWDVATGANGGGSLRNRIREAVRDLEADIQGIVDSFDFTNSCLGHCSGGRGGAGGGGGW